MYNKNKKNISYINIMNTFKVKSYKKKHNEKYMNKLQLEHFKYILEEWQIKLTNKIKYTISCMKDEVTNFPDLVDRAVQEEKFNLELRNLDRERKLIKKIEKTLKKVKNKNFGFCESCGIEIGIRRLEARPTADLCIDCKTISEIRKKQIYNFS